jgi:hypothetical protein
MGGGWGCKVGGVVRTWLLEHWSSVPWHTPPAHPPTTLPRLHPQTHRIDTRTSRVVDGFNQDQELLKGGFLGGHDVPACVVASAGPRCVCCGLRPPQNLQQLPHALALIHGKA